MGKQAKLRRDRKDGIEKVTWTPFVEANFPLDEMARMKAATSDKPYKVFMNNDYQVIVTPIGTGPYGEGLQLSIKRRDKRPIRDWRVMQRIKNELVHPEAEAIEIFPAESRLVDTANQYFLFCFTDFRWPFGFEERLVSRGGMGAVNRGFDEPPADLKSAEFMRELVTTEMARRMAAAAGAGLPHPVDQGASSDAAPAGGDHSTSPDSARTSPQDQPAGG